MEKYAMSRKEQYSVRKYLANMATRYDLENEELIECVREALNNKTSKCGALTITCRKKKKEAAIFLFESGEDLYQFPIPFEVLRIFPKRFPRTLRW